MKVLREYEKGKKLFMQWLLNELENMVIELYMAYEHRNYRRSVKSQGKSLILCQSQWKVWENCVFRFVVFFKISKCIFFSKKTKSMLQSKQNDQFDTPRLTHVVVVVSGFRCECFLSNTFSLIPRKAGRGWKWRENYRRPAKKLKWM